MNQKERDELLTELKVDICWIKKILGNHLKHHQTFTVTLLAIALTSVISLIIALL